MTTDAAGPVRDAATPRPDAGARRRPDAESLRAADAVPESVGGSGTPQDIGGPRRAWLDLAWWCALAAVGLAVTALAVQGGAKLGTASAPFLGAYRFQLSPLSILAPAVAAIVVSISASGILDRFSWRVIMTLSYVAALAWAFALAFVDGASGLTRSLRDSMNYAPDIAAIGSHPLHYITTYTADVESHTFAARGHPPGSVLLLWALERAGITNLVTLGALITMLGVATVPLVLYAVRDVCGETTARRYAPILILAPYAIWVAVSMDGVVAALGALAVAAGVYASGRGRRGRTAAMWSVLCGVLVGLAGMFAYSVVWLGLSVVLLYFARRRPFLNIGSGLGALIPVTVANLLGFNWLAGLTAAGYDFQTRIEPHRSALWWSGISLVALILACGPALYASARKIRNTPAWPFLIGAAIAVLFTLVTAQARGGAEAAWLPFFPWLTVAAVAPIRQAGPPPPVPWPLVGGGALTAVVVEALLTTPW
jgi:methylthioxylose transferase